MANELIRATMAFLVDRKAGVVHLARRKVEPFKNSYSGYGGKLEKDETPLACIVREIKEEAYVEVLRSELEWIGIMDTHRIHGFPAPLRFRVHLYVATSWAGTILESDEMSLPTIISLDDIALSDLRPEIVHSLRHIEQRTKSGIWIRAYDIDDGHCDVTSSHI